MNETKFARFDLVETDISSTNGIIIIQILGILMFIFVLILRQGSATVKRTNPRFAKATAEAQKFKACFHLQKYSSQNLSSSG